MRKTTSERASERVGGCAGAEPPAEGWTGWDAYAQFYDWENARTFGRRDVAFWRETVARERGPVLELGCGTGRLLLPLARHGAAITGVDRSAPMLARARDRSARLARRLRPRLVRGDVRALPFADRSFGVVLAPYGILQSLLTDVALDDALGEASRVLCRGGLFGVDLVPELPGWAESGPRVRLKGRAPRGGSITLIESVRQDRRRRLTIFDEQFVESRGTRTRRRRFSLTFRTQPMPVMLARLRRAGLRADVTLGDYGGAPWDEHAETWLILGRKK